VPVHLVEAIRRLSLLLRTPVGKTLVVATANGRLIRLALPSRVLSRNTRPPFGKQLYTVGEDFFLALAIGTVAHCSFEELDVPTSIRLAGVVSTN